MATPHTNLKQFLQKMWEEIVEAICSKDVGHYRFQERCICHDKFCALDFLSFDYENGSDIFREPMQRPFKKVYFCYSLMGGFEL